MKVRPRWVPVPPSVRRLTRFLFQIVCLAALLVCALAQRDQDEAPKPYQFQYAEKIGGEGEVAGSISHSANADASGKVEGRYSLEIEDGRRREVEYVADKDGFRASVKSNEPGFQADSPADAVYNLFRRK